MPDGRAGGHAVRADPRALVKFSEVGRLRPGGRAAPGVRAARRAAQRQRAAACSTGSYTALSGTEYQRLRTGHPARRLTAMPGPSPRAGRSGSTRTPPERFVAARDAAVAEARRAGDPATARRDRPAAPADRGRLAGQPARASRRPELVAELVAARRRAARRPAGPARAPSCASCPPSAGRWSAPWSPRSASWPPRPEAPPAGQAAAGRGGGDPDRGALRRRGGRAGARRPAAAGRPATPASARCPGRSCGWSPAAPRSRPRTPGPRTGTTGPGARGGRTADGAAARRTGPPRARAGRGGAGRWSGSWPGPTDQERAEAELAGADGGRAGRRRRAGPRSRPSWPSWSGGGPSPSRS